ncbi:hypothetical protein K7W42_22105, partial [Deinococcus sp. HMF7604]|uniref:hypothetical protein n=1 Tax=Deinococcus betulae TaxID=2873312 RepID=UPI001CCD0682
MPPRQLPAAPARPDTAPVGLEVRMLRVMIGGPNDTTEEREVARQVVAEWNLQHAEAEEIVLLPKHWTTHTRPALRGRAQAVVNEQLTDRADVLVALFWSRLGTDTGVAESGTVEEIDKFHASGRSVLLYFAEKPLPFQKAGNADTQAELRRVQEFRARVEQDHLGLYDTYSTTAHFRDLFA